MRTAPPDLPESSVLARVRASWALEAARVEHLPWGFGAWHWAATDETGVRRWFVTADRLDHPGRLAELERAYAAAAVLSGHLPAVAAEPTLAGEFYMTVGGFALSVTRWVDGARPGHGELDEDAATQTAGFLSRLHEMSADVDVWDHRYRSHQVLDVLADLVPEPWDSGPFGEEARDLVRGHLAEIAEWRCRFALRAEQALTDRDAWVVTHGEPGPHNQIVTGDGRRWVDWESVRIAPRERDLDDLLAAPTDIWRQAYPHPIDPARVELFDLAWRLDEIGQYAERFRQSHTGTDDDRIALEGLREELTRADRLLPSRLHLDRP